MHHHPYDLRGKPLLGILALQGGLLQALPWRVWDWKGRGRKRGQVRGGEELKMQLRMRCQVGDVQATVRQAKRCMLRTDCALKFLRAGSIVHNS